MKLGMSATRRQDHSPLSGNPTVLVTSQRCHEPHRCTNCPLTGACPVRSPGHSLPERLAEEEGSGVLAHQRGAAGVAAVCAHVPRRCPLCPSGHGPCTSVPRPRRVLPSVPGPGLCPRPLGLQTGDWRPSPCPEGPAQRRRSNRKHALFYLSPPRLYPNTEQRGFIKHI